MYAVLSILMLLCYFTMIGVTIAGGWGAFAKANRPGWAIFVPIYNTLVMIDIAGKPWWWIFLLLIPIASIVFAIMILISFANAYGKGVGFALGLIFLPMVFFPLLGFGDAEYIGSRASY
jgi:uncharacterized protein DUF5684